MYLFVSIVPSEIIQNYIHKVIFAPQIIQSTPQQVFSFKSQFRKYVLASQLTCINNTLMNEVRG